MPELHPIVVPAMLYNAVLCGLITAACWHVVTIGDRLVRRLRKTTDR